MARTSCSGRVREDVGLWQMGLVVECRGGCARCRDASEGACHNQQADCVGFMSDCIYDTQLALLRLSLWPGVLLGLRPNRPGVMSYV